MTEHGDLDEHERADVVDGDPQHNHAYTHVQNSTYSHTRRYRWGRSKGRRLDKWGGE
jgi:hypothetical protein